MASQKHKDFTKEGVGEKLVTDVPGIGSELGDALKQNGIKYAYEVVGQFLVLKKDRERFKEWLKTKCAGTKREWNMCCEAVSDWCDAHT